MLLRSGLARAAPVAARGALGPGSLRFQVTSAMPRKDAAPPPRPVEEIPGPKNYPLIGCLPTMIKSLNMTSMYKFFMRMHEHYGPIFRMVNPGAPPMVAVVDPVECERLNKLTMANPHRPALDSLIIVRDKYVNKFFEGKFGVVLEQGEEWWRVRSRVQTPMMRPKKVSLYLERMDQVALDFTDRVAALQSEFGEMPSNFQMELYKWALESVGLVALNRRLGCLSPDLDPAGEQMTIIQNTNDMFSALTKLEMGINWWRLLPSPSFRKLERCHTSLLATLLPTIAEAESRLGRGVAQGEEEEEEEEEMPLLETLILTPGLTRKDVVTFMLDFFFAGIDTTSHAVAFALYLLARNPTAQHRLQREVDEVIGGHTGPLTQQHVARLVYLKAVIKEALRIFPLTFGVARLLTEDTVIKGYEVPAGYMVIPLTMLTGWQEEHFPRAKEFLPERWLRERPLGPINPYASLPFGFGTRMCVGRRLAEQEMYTLLTRMMQRYTVDYKYEDMDLETRLLSKPSQPLKFNFIERN